MISAMMAHFAPKHRPNDLRYTGSNWPLFPSSAQAMVDGLNFVIETPKEVEQNNGSIQPK